MQEFLVVARHLWLCENVRTRGCASELRHRTCHKMLANFLGVEGVCDRFALWPTDTDDVYGSAVIGEYGVEGC